MAGSLSWIAFSVIISFRALSAAATLSSSSCFCFSDRILSISCLLERSIPRACSSSFTFWPSSATAVLLFFCCSSANCFSSWTLRSFSRWSFLAVWFLALSSPLLPLSPLSCCLACKFSASFFSSINRLFSSSRRCFLSSSEQPFPSCDISRMFNAERTRGASEPLHLIFLYSFSRFTNRDFSFCINSRWLLSSAWSRRLSSSACRSVSCCCICNSWRRLCSPSTCFLSSSLSFSNCCRIISRSRSSCSAASRCFCSNSSNKSCSVSKNSNSICRSRSILSCLEIIASSISFMACACFSSSSTSRFFSDSIICFSCSCSRAAFSNNSIRSSSNLSNRSRSCWSLLLSSSRSWSSRCRSSSICFKTSCCCFSNNWILCFSCSILLFSFSLSSFNILIWAFSSSSNCFITTDCRSFISSNFFLSSSISSLSSCCLS